MRAVIKHIKEQPKPIQIVYGIAFSFALYKIYGLLFQNQQSQNNQILLTQNDKELAAYLKQNQLTFSPSQYSQFANTIYEGTKYGIGDNYPAVETVLKKMNNNADVAMLVKTYGERQNYIFGFPQGEKKDLFTNIRSELGANYGFFSGHLENVNKDWKSKKITYTL